MNRLSLLFRSGLSAAAFGVALAAQSPLPTPVPTASHAAPAALLGDAPALPAGQVLLGDGDDGRLWALGSTYKASFGADGFVYVPFLGSDAPRDYPVQLSVETVRVGGQPLSLARAADVHRDGCRVTLDRGTLREVYQLASDRVEQTFVVGADAAGDVDVELRVSSDLVDDASRPGLQLGNDLGGVDYGTAYLVLGTTKTEVATSFADGVLRLHVPASQRGDGPVVIDPIVTTKIFAATLMVSDLPDIAYDATTNHWAVTWVHVFSQTDHDVLAEVRTENGDPIPGGARVIEVTTESFSAPRIANLNSADRFLIAMERWDGQQQPGQQYTVWARTLDAAAPFNVGSRLPLSDPGPFDQRAVDVGGDPGNGQQWFVVWSYGTNVHGRTVAADGTLGPTAGVEVTLDPCINPQISLSNGNGLTARPGWCVVYMRQAAPGAKWDVYGTVLDTSGAILVYHQPIAAGTDDDLYTHVSSPLVDAGSKPAFLVSWERQQSTGPEMITRLVDADLMPLTPEIDMTRRYGYSGIYCRVESDGARFAAACVVGQLVEVGTLSFTGNDLVLHESLQTIGGNGISPNLASERSGGGQNTTYGLVWTNKGYTPARIALTVYDGHSPQGGFHWRGGSCGPWLTSTGEPYLGRTVGFTVEGANGAPTGLLLGLPGSGLVLCGGCTFYLDPSRPIVPLASPANLPLPSAAWTVGLTLSVQGYSLDTGGCLPVLLTDAAEFTLQ